MKTEIKRFSIRNVGSTYQYQIKGQRLNSIIEMENHISVPAAEVIDYFKREFTYIDPKFFEVFDMNVQPFEKVALQSYYTKDDFGVCVNFHPSFFYRGINQETFNSFTKKHGIYFEASLSHVYYFCRHHFNEFCSWGGQNAFLMRGKERLYWVSFPVSNADDCWPPGRDYSDICVEPQYDGNFQGSDYPFLLATPTLFAKTIRVAIIATFA